MSGDMDAQVYHDICTADWNIPQMYKEIDAKEFLLMLCDTAVEVERVEKEYAMFEERKLIPLLQFLIFIVDYMRKYKVVWGVGRGSSVASYCLYLLGVHKVDSIKYDLPIEEFLK
jgi:DNA polymerase III alpha subunit